MSIAPARARRSGSRGAHRRHALGQQPSTAARMMRSARTVTHELSSIVEAPSLARARAPACHQGRETLAEARVAGAGATGRVAAFNNAPATPATGPRTPVSGSRRRRWTTTTARSFAFATTAAFRPTTPSLGVPAVRSGDLGDTFGRGISDRLQSAHFVVEVTQIADAPAARHATTSSSLGLTPLGVKRPVFLDT